MALLSDKFTEAMNLAGLTREQQEAIVAALAAEPNVIAAFGVMGMDRADRLASRRP